ncbi:MAG: ABC transporter permease [Thermoproteota archaeon]|jgi:ABC-2 type transport system permease protein|nr:ABC transporter permease [Thermoproteota archaeon]
MINNSNNNSSSNSNNNSNSNNSKNQILQSGFCRLEYALSQVYAIWLREFKVFLRERSRLVASTFTPLLWLFVIGSGFGSTTAYTDLDYQTFIFPGIICMSVIFSSVFYGSYIIWDRKFDFLKSVMVAPVSRGIIFAGKTFGGMSNSLVQAFILLIVGALIGIQFTAVSLFQTVAVVLLLSFALTSLGLALGSYMHSLEGFQMIVSFVVLPLFFLSGALFPLDNLPEWLSLLTILDPATYAVDALRNAILNLGGNYSFEADIGILTAFTTGLGTFGIFSFKRMKAV